jgi:hypothetical protein
MTLRSCLGFGIAILALPLNSAAFGQAAIQLNPTCSIQNVVAPAGTLKLENVIINCGKGADPRTALKVNYFWLDAFSAAQLLAGRNDARLRDLLDSRPVVLSNEVTEAFEELQKKFGTTIGSHSLFREYYDHFNTRVDAPRRSTRSFRTPADSYRSSDFHGVRVFDGMSPIYWPDVAAVREMTTTPQFPRGYRHYVRKPYMNLAPIINSRRSLTRSDVSEIMNTTLISRVFFRNVSSAELDSYRDRLMEMKEAALAGSLKIEFPAGSAPRIPQSEPPQDDKAIEDWYRSQDRERISRLHELATNKTVSALQFITRDGMPADFLTAYGIQQDHANVPSGWGIVALPRRPFLQIAVVENTATTATDYDLVEFVVKRDRETKLRQPVPDSSPETRSIPFPQGRLSHHERVVIPLSIEFREHRKVGDKDRQESLDPDDATFALVRRGLTRIRDTHVIARDDAGAPMTFFPPKPKELFDVSQPPQNIEPVYVYGPRYALHSAKLQGQQIPMRTAMVAGIYKVAGFDGGSCPILYYRVHGSSEWHKVGSVLRLAAGEVRRSTETVDLPNDVSEIALVEEEPERTYVASLTVTARNADGRERNVVTAGSAFTLDAEQVWSAVVPPIESGETVRVRLTGHYVPYSWALRAGKDLN